MGYADGQGDLPEEVRTFIVDLIKDETFRQLPPDLRERAKRLAQMELGA
jgi:hypothetical protein